MPPSVPGVASDSESVDQLAADARTAAARSAAIADLSRQYRLPLLRFFEKRIQNGCTAEIEDLTQEVFLRLASSPGLDSVERMEAYLFTAAANLLRDRQRRRISHATGAHEPYDEAVHGGSQELPGPERIALDAQYIERLAEALHELPERTRSVFVLYHLENLPHAEIARRLGIAVRTIEKHVFRANAHLLHRIDRSP